MKAADVLNVQKSLLLQMSRVKATCVDKENSIFKFTLPFRGHKDMRLELFAYQKPKGKKILLTDAGRMAAAVEDTPTAKAFISKFAKLYGLVMMEDETVMEISNRPLGERVAAMMQMLVALDGIYRSFVVNERKS